MERDRDTAAPCRPHRVNGRQEYSGRRRQRLHRRHSAAAALWMADRPAPSQSMALHQIRALGGIRCLSRWPWALVAGGDTSGLQVVRLVARTGLPTPSLYDLNQRKNAKYQYISSPDLQLRTQWVGSIGLQRDVVKHPHQQNTAQLRAKKTSKNLIHFFSSTFNFALPAALL